MTDLPSTWTRIPLAKVGRWVGGGTPSKANPRFWTNGTIPWVSPKDMKVDVVSDAQDHITEEAIGQSATNLVETGSVLMVVRSGILRHTLPVAVTLRPVALNQDLKAVKPNENIRSDYLALALRAFQREILHECSKTGTTVQSLNLPALLGFEIPLPPRDEQQRIVAETEKQFTRVEVGMATLKHVQANLRRYRAAVLIASCQGRLEHYARLSPVLGSEPSALPSGWVWKTVGELLSERPCNGISVRGSDHPPGVRSLRLNAMSDKGFDYSKVRYLPLRREDVDDLWIEQGDFFVSRGNGSINLVGRGTEAQQPPEPTIFPDTMIRLRLAPDICATHWLPTIWSAPLIRKQIEQRVKTTAGIYKISQPELLSIQVPFPPVDEQRRIVAEVERRLSVIEEIERFVDANLQRATRLRQSILNRAFSGRLVKSKVTKKSAAKTKEMSPASRRHFLRALLSAEIVHQLHAEPTFGQIKHQKIFHLCEHIAEIADLDVQYHRDAAGPYDNRLIYTNEAELKRQKWYESYSRKKVGHGYRPLAKAGGHEKYLERYWPEKLETIKRLIRLMRRWDTERCEIFSTAYAAWNDLLFWGQEATDDAIVHEVLHRWHESKQRIPEERWRKALEWMRKKGFVPTGFGKPTAAARS
jgi:type I restriction enzyme S subunit